MVLPTKKSFITDSTHVKYWTKENIIPFLESKGFKIIKVWHFPINIENIKDVFWFNELRIKAIKR